MKWVLKWNKWRRRNAWSEPQVSHHMTKGSADWAVATHPIGSSRTLRVRSESSNWSDQTVTAKNHLTHQMECFTHTSVVTNSWTGEESRRSPPKPGLWLDVGNFRCIQTRPIRRFHNRWWQLVLIHKISHVVVCHKWFGQNVTGLKCIRREVFKTEESKTRLENSAQIDGNVRLKYNYICTCI